MIKELAMSSSNKCFGILVAILVIFFGLSKVHAQQKSTGNPVSGGEIYIELEPDDNPIVINNPTNENGVVTGNIVINQPPAQKPRKIKIFIKYPEKVWNDLAKKFKKADLVGEYKFSLEVTIGGKVVMVKNLPPTIIKKGDDLNSMAKMKSGPYEASLSNIEDNIFKPAPSGDKKVPVTIKLMCTGVK